MLTKYQNLKKEAKVIFNITNKNKVKPVGTSSDYLNKRNSKLQLKIEALQIAQNDRNRNMRPANSIQTRGVGR